MKTKTTKFEFVPDPETVAVEQPAKRRPKRAKKSAPAEPAPSAYDAPTDEGRPDAAQEPTSAESAPQALHESDAAEAAHEHAQESVSAEPEQEPDATPPKRAKRGTRKAKAPATDAAPAKRKRSTKDSPKPDAPDATTLAGLAERYLRSIEDEGRSGSTVSAYRADLGIAIGHFGEDAAIASITPRRIMSFNESDTVTLTRHGTPKASPTVERTRRVLRLALAFAEDQGLLPPADAK